MVGTRDSRAFQSGQWMPSGQQELDPQVGFFFRFSSLTRSSGSPLLITCKILKAYCISDRRMLI